MAPANGPKNKSHDKYGETGTYCRTIWGSSPVYRCCQEGSAKEFRNQNPDFGFFATWYFHIEVFSLFNFTINIIDKSTEILIKGIKNYWKIIFG